MRAVVGDRTGVILVILCLGDGRKLRRRSVGFNVSSIGESACGGSFTLYFWTTEIAVGMKPMGARPRPYSAGEPGNVQSDLVLANPLWISRDWTHQRPITLVTKASNMDGSRHGDTP